MAHCSLYTPHQTFLLLCPHSCCSLCQTPFTHFSTSANPIFKSWLRCHLMNEYSYHLLRVAISPFPELLFWSKSPRGSFFFFFRTNGCSWRTRNVLYPSALEEQMELGNGKRIANSPPPRPSSPSPPYLANHKGEHSTLKTWRSGWSPS